MSGTNCHGPVARYKSPIYAQSGLAVPAFRIPLGTVGRLGLGLGATGAGGGGGGVMGAGGGGGDGGASTVGAGESEVMLVGRGSIESSSISTGSSKPSPSPSSSLLAGAAVALWRKVRSRTRSSDRVSHRRCLPTGGDV